ncbi:MAG: O-antigen ligase family protein [Clostridia bacterium]|nr:O-antigen ligase family protein [Clostridia bacterium]
MKLLKTIGAVPPETALPILTILLNAFFGGYNDFIGCVGTALLSAAALICAIRRRFFVLDKNLGTVGMLCYSAGYLLTCAFAVDRGLAFLGFIRSLSLPLMLFICMQTEQKERDRILRSVPWIGLAQMAFCVPAYFIAPLRDYFYSFGRFHGGFGYSNTFALFLLCGIMILLTDREEKSVLRRLLPAAALLTGILLSGSRTVFLLFIPAAIFLIVRQKKLRLPLIVGAGAIVAAAAVYGLVSGNHRNIARFLELSLANSTLTDRLLYYYDALRIIPRHLFGLGYRGYQFLVQGVQSGYYSVTYVHCEYLQLILDIGVIPALLFFCGLFRNFFTPLPLRNKLLLGVIALHIAVDFDLQFMSVLLLLPLLARYGDEPAREKKAQKKPGRASSGRVKPTRFPAAAVVLCSAAFGLSAWLSAAAGAEALNHYKLAVKLYPGMTLSRIVLMRDSEDNADMLKHAEYLIRHNGRIPVAYDAAARADMARGGYDAAIEKKNKAIENAPLVISEYEDKFNVLYQAIWYADGIGDTDAVARYCNEMIALPDELMIAQARLSPLGKKIKDQPDLTLSDKAAEYIETLRRSMQKR